MSELIKLGNRARQVLPLSALPLQQQPMSARDAEIEALRRRVADLERSVAGHEAARAEAAAECERCYRAGEARGREAGRAEADHREAERVTLLENAIVEAQTKFDTCLQSTERLAADLARDCLDKVFGDGATRAAMVADTLGWHLRTVDRAMLVSIEVAEDDFADPSSLAGLAARVGAPSVELVASLSLVPGGCLITLRLGQMDIGVGTQWKALRAELVELTEASS